MISIIYTQQVQKGRCEKTQSSFFTSPLCILITSTIRTFLRITGRLFVACTTIRAGNCDHVQLGRIYWLIIHQFLFARENFITYRAWIIFIFSLIFKNIYGHAQWVWLKFPDRNWSEESLLFLYDSCQNNGRRYSLGSCRLSCRKCF